MKWEFRVQQYVESIETRTDGDPIVKAQNNTTSTAQATTAALLKKPLLQYGDRGSAVAELQKLLFHWGTYNSTVNGIFDQTVEIAVKAFQHRVFLQEDGIVGSLTWQALYTGAPVNMPVLQLGSQGEAAIALQSVLQRAGYFNRTINGQFDLHTDAAVRAFQRRYGLVPDGVVGPHTWCALSKIPH